MKLLGYKMASAVFVALALFTTNNLNAQDNLTSDSLIYRQLKDYNVTFSDKNSVTILMS